MSTLSQRHQIIALVNDAVMAGARQDRACEAIALSVRTLRSAGRSTRPAVINVPHGYKHP